jgi:hypothetical protein
MPVKERKSAYVTGSELAHRAGYSNGFITQMRQSGRLAGSFRKARGKKYIVYHLDRCLEIFKEMDISRSKKKGQNPTGEYNQQRSELIKVQKERAAFELAVRKKEFISAEKAKRESFTAARIFRDNLLNLPGKLSALVAAKSKKAEKQIYQLLRSEINKALREIQDDLRKIGKADE